MIDNYERLCGGAIRQICSEPFVYDEKYVLDRYDQYGTQCDMMSHLRWGYILGGIPSGKPKTVLDIGYGNGSFLQTCQKAGCQTFGNDISQYELKYGTALSFEECLERPFDLVTMFDSLEHFRDIDFLRKLQCSFLCTSVPNCRYDFIEKEYGTNDADAYFTSWKHRRPNEHLWHFNIESLTTTLNEFGYYRICASYCEDVIRKSEDCHPNILTAIFSKQL